MWFSGTPNLRISALTLLCLRESYPPVRHLPENASSKKKKVSVSNRRFILSTFQFTSSSLFVPLTSNKRSCIFGEEVGCVTFGLGSNIIVLQGLNVYRETTNPSPLFFFLFFFFFFFSSTFEFFYKSTYIYRK